MSEGEMRQELGAEDFEMPPESVVESEDLGAIMPRIASGDPFPRLQNMDPFPRLNTDDDVLDELNIDT